MDATKTQQQETLAGNRGSSAESQADEQELAEIVRTSIRRALSYFGGAEVSESVLYILELDHGVNLSNILNELGLLRAGLGEMFGESATAIEDQICIQLAKQLGVDHHGRTFIELVAFAREYLSGRKSRRD